MNKDFTLLLQLSREIAELHDRAMQAEKLMVEAVADRNVWRRTSYYLGGLLAVHRPNENPEKIVRDAEKSVRGE